MDGENVQRPPRDPRTEPTAGRGWGFWWGIAALATLALAPLGPWLAGLLWSCPFKEWTGIPCPSCGLTRAALALARLEPWHALTHYPLQTVAWLVFLGGGLMAGTLALFNRPLPRLGPWPLWTQILLFLAVLANWAYSIATGV